MLLIRRQPCWKFRILILSFLWKQFLFSVIHNECDCLYAFYLRTIQTKHGGCEYKVCGLSIYNTKWPLQRVKTEESMGENGSEWILFWPTKRSARVSTIAIVEWMLYLTCFSWQKHLCKAIVWWRLHSVVLKGDTKQEFLQLRSRKQDHDVI